MTRNNLLRPWCWSPDQVHALGDLIAGGDADPEEVGRAVLTAVACWSAQKGPGKPMPLSRYLGLTTLAKFRRAQRDAHLRRAAALLPLPPSATIWDRAAELAKEIKRFRRSREWQRWRMRVVLPAEGSDLQRELAAALRLAARTPERGQLRNILLEE